MRTRAQVSKKSVTTGSTNDEDDECDQEDEVSKSGRATGREPSSTPRRTSSSKTKYKAGNKYVNADQRGIQVFHHHAPFKQSNATAKYAKGIARELCPNGGCCLLTGRSKGILKGAMHVAHIIPKRMRNDHKCLAALESAWGLSMNSLNINEPRNLMFLDSIWHCQFDEDSWVLLPTVHDVETIKNRDTEEPIYQALTTPQRDAEPLVFKYYFLPLRPDIMDLSRVDGENEPTTYRYPFSDVPNHTLSHIM